MSKLPIDIIPNTSPPKFKWRGPQGQVMEGSLPASVEAAVVALIKQYKQLDNELRSKVDEQ